MLDEGPDRWTKGSAAILPRTGESPAPHRRGLCDWRLLTAHAVGSPRRCLGAWWAPPPSKRVGRVIPVRRVRFPSTSALRAGEANPPPSSSLHRLPRFARLGANRGGRPLGGSWAGELGR